MPPSTLMLSETATSSPTQLRLSRITTNGVITSLPDRTREAARNRIDVEINLNKKYYKIVVNLTLMIFFDAFVREKRFHPVPEKRQGLELLYE